MARTEYEPALRPNSSADDSDASGSAGPLKSGNDLCTVYPGWRGFKGAHAKTVVMSFWSRQRRTAHVGSHNFTKVSGPITRPP